MGWKVDQSHGHVGSSLNIFCLPNFLRTARRNPECFNWDVFIWMVLWLFFTFLDIRGINFARKIYPVLVKRLSLMMWKKVNLCWDLCNGNININFESFIVFLTLEERRYEIPSVCFSVFGVISLKLSSQFSDFFACN